MTLIKARGASIQRAKYSLLFRFLLFLLFDYLILSSLIIIGSIAMIFGLLSLIEWLGHTQ